MYPAFENVPLVDRDDNRFTLRDVSHALRLELALGLGTSRTFVLPSEPKTIQDVCDILKKYLRLDVRPA